MKIDREEFFRWLSDPEVREDILVSEPYEGFEELPYEEDEFAQLCVRHFSPMSLEEIGNISGLSKERIRQIAEEGMDKERRKKNLGIKSILDEYDSSKKAMKPVAYEWRDAARRRRQRGAK